MLLRLIILMMVFPLFAFAVPTLKKAEKDKMGWDGSIQAGGVFNTGNSQQLNVNGKATVQYRHTHWQGNAELEGELNTSKGDTTAARVAFKGEGRYHFDTKNYTFIHVETVADRFATYDLIFSDAIGYGRIILNDDNNYLSAELGPGSRQSRISGRETYQVEAILNVDGKYIRRLTDTTQFTQTVNFDIGNENTHTKLVSALKTKMSKNLALELSYTVENDTKIPKGSKNTKRTDTITKLAVVYDF